MAGAKGVINAFFPVGKSTDPAELTVGVEYILPTCKQLMRIRLVADIPDEHIVGGIKDVVKGDGEFHHPKAGTQVSLLGRYDLDNVLSQLFRQRYELFGVELAQVRWVLDRIEKGSIHAGKFTRDSFCTYRII